MYARARVSVVVVVVAAVVVECRARKNCTQLRPLWPTQRSDAHTVSRGGIRCHVQNTVELAAAPQGDACHTGHRDPRPLPRETEWMLGPQMYVMAGDEPVALRQLQTTITALKKVSRIQVSRAVVGVVKVSNRIRRPRSAGRVSLVEAHASVSYSVRIIAGVQGCGRARPGPALPRSHRDHCVPAQRTGSDRVWLYCVRGTVFYVREGLECAEPKCAPDLVYSLEHKLLPSVCTGGAHRAVAARAFA